MPKVPKPGEMLKKAPRPGPTLVVTGLLGIFIGAAAVALVRRLVLGRTKKPESEA